MCSIRKISREKNERSNERYDIYMVMVEKLIGCRIIIPQGDIAIAMMCVILNERSNVRSSLEIFIVILLIILQYDNAYDYYHSGAKT